MCVRLVEIQFDSSMDIILTGINGPTELNNMFYILSDKHDEYLRLPHTHTHTARLIKKISVETQIKSKCVQVKEKKSSMKWIFFIPEVC